MSGLESIPSYKPDMELKEVAKVKGELERDRIDPIQFVSGEFKMNPKLWDAYLREADTLMAAAKKEGIELDKTDEWGRATLDFNKDGKVTREEIAAAIFARSSRSHSKLNAKGELVVSVDTKLDGIKRKEGAITTFGDYPDKAFEEASRGPFKTSEFEATSKSYIETARKEAKLLNDIAKLAYGQNVTGTVVDTSETAKQQLNATANEARLSRDR